MLKQVTLLGERQIFDSPRRRGHVPLEVIVGLEDADGNRNMMRPGDPRHPVPHEVTPRRTNVALGEAAVGRLMGIYGRLFSDGETMDYDCNGLPLYLYGGIDKLHRGPFPGFGHSRGANVFPNDLEVGRPYAVIDALGQSVHAMVATDSMHSLSFLGRSADGGGLLVLGANPNLMQTYGGVHIREITGEGGERLDIAA